MNDTASVKLLLEHDARTDEALDGLTPWQQAMQHGHVEVARMLELAGAPVSSLSDVERFTAACLAGDEAAAPAMLASDPDLRRRAPQDMARRAVGTRRKESLSLVLDLGFDPNFQDDSAAIHSLRPGDEELLRILLARGGSITLREPWYDGTGVEWANFADYRELRDLMLDEAPICLFDALDFDRLDRISDIVARDPDSLERPFAKNLTREPKPDDWHTPLTRMVDRGKTEAVRALLQLGASTSARHPDGRTLLQLARDKGFDEIAALLEAKGSGTGA
jgi:ankyrin repeat protein